MSWGAGKRDHNEAEIVSALLKAGCDVEYAYREPYDLIVGRARTTYLLEVKSRKGELRQSQEMFQKTWRGQYAIVRSPIEALRAVGL